MKIILSFLLSSLVGVEAVTLTNVPISGLPSTNIVTGEALIPLVEDRGGTLTTLQTTTSNLFTWRSAYRTFTVVGQPVVEISTNIVVLGGDNNLPVYEQGYIRITSNQADPLAANVLLGSGAAPGASIILQNTANGTGFTLLNGSPLWDDPLQIVTLKGGSWVTSGKGDTIEVIKTPYGWAEKGRWWGSATIVTGDNLWQMTNGVMFTLPNIVTNGWEFREGGVAQFFVNTNGDLRVGSQTPPQPLGEVLASESDVGTGGSWFKDIYIRATNSLSGSYGNVDLYADTNSASWSMQFVTNGVTYQAQMNVHADPAQFQFSGNLGAKTSWLWQPLQYPATAEDTIFTFNDLQDLTDRPIMAIRRDGTNQISFGPDARITWGEGGTNVLRRDGSDLVYTNGNTLGTYLRFSTDAGTHEARFGVQSSIAKILGPTGGSIALTPAIGTPGDVFVSTSGVTPDLDNHFDIGGAASNEAWRDGYFKGKMHHEWEQNGAGIMSGLDVFATNGIGIFDFVNTGAGTPFSKFSFRSNGVELASLSGSVGNVISTGASVAGQIPTYTGTDGKSVVPTNGLALLNVGTLTFTGGAANVVPVFDGSTNLIPSRTTTNELDYVHNVTNAIQTQLANKADLTLTTDQSMSGRLLTPSLTVGAMAISRGTLTHAGGNVIVDFAATNRYWSCTITGNVTFVLTNAVAGKWANLLLFNPSANATPTFNFPANSITNWFGGAPSTLTANTVGALSYYCISTDTNAVKAAYAETQ